MKKNGMRVYLNPLSRVSNRPGEFMRFQIVRAVNSRNGEAYKTLFPERTFTYHQAKAFAHQLGYRIGSLE